MKSSKLSLQLTPVLYSNLLNLGVRAPLTTRLQRDSKLWELQTLLFVNFKEVVGPVEDESFDICK